MPDWSYQTLFRPLLFRLPARLARTLTLHAMGGLSRIPGGSLVIRTLGHMEVSPLLEQKRLGLDLKYPIGLGGGVDPHGTAQRALAQFGFGFTEIGPITMEPIRSDQPVELDITEEAIRYPSAPVNDGLAAIVERLKDERENPLPAFCRLRPMPGSAPEEALDQVRRMLEALKPFAAGFYLDLPSGSWPSDVMDAYTLDVLRLTKELAPDKPALVYLQPDMDDREMMSLLGKLNEAGLHFEGAVIGDTVTAGDRRLTGRAIKASVMRKLQRIRSEYAMESIALIAAGGVHEPQDALDLTEAGADLVQLHSGLVFSGPGLPKRVNEAILYRIVSGLPAPPLPAFWQGWGWMCLLGIGMIIGGIIAWIIAATSVVLPYDTAFLCADAETIASINERLLPFMSHDRITLAGTMLSIGVLYYQLGRYGLRERLHWARTALMASGIVGFSSFFLYLGYGYFDPLHATAAAILLPMFILAMRDRQEEPYRRKTNIMNSRQWRLAQRGQFMMVVLGVSLVIGGFTISTVGITKVFVPEDLEYLMTTAAVLESANPNLLPLIAHDRAGFGGALLSNAIALVATALWGIQQGARWLWWTFLGAGTPAFVAAFSVHMYIGYMDFWHLSPAIFALLLYMLGLILLYPYLMRPVSDSKHARVS
ncbi:hypothetical protein [Paenibacillus spongiae]|uniref:Dihydroorotate dehydrogenase catalytic domain-containing protein n=1 Tax=Paenibacillus spongiae TaxID=2909671 RepID=A0ABY5S5H4_9BACL|nr:hypothetical protein [Paenibacillus spongiae]UVI27993.1 hypothetical protein L1F29_21365 [Paenibacillus spongiae]